MPKNMLFDAEARDALVRGLNSLVDTVRVTLGPWGRNVVLDKRAGSPTITNDGVTIAKEIELEDPFMNMGARLGREVCAKTQDEVGDGTTTALVLAQALVREGHRVVSAGANPMAVKRGMERGAEAIVEHVLASAKRVQPGGRLQPVISAALNDETLTALLTDALTRVGDDGLVTVEEGRGLESTLSVVEGMQFDRGYLSPYFVTDPERMAVAIEDALVLITDGKLMASGDVVPALERAAAEKRSLAVIADEVADEALATLVVNRLRGTLTTVAVKAPAFGDRRQSLLDDLAVLTGATVLRGSAGDDPARAADGALGRAERMDVDRDSTTVLAGRDRRKETEFRLTQLRSQLSAAESEYDREQLLERLARLSSGIGVIRVGAATEIEMHERKARVEDALAAARAALAEGVVVGGGAALLQAAQQIKVDATGDEALGVAAVCRAAEAPAAQIAANAGRDGAVIVDEMRRRGDGAGLDMRTGRLVDLRRAGVLDPAKVVRVALRGAVSIAGLILTTQTLVAEVDEEDGDGDA